MDSTAVEFASEPPRDLIAHDAGPVRPDAIFWQGSRRVAGLRAAVTNDNAPLLRPER